MAVVTVEQARGFYAVACWLVERNFHRGRRIARRFWLELEGYSIAYDLAVAERHGPYRGPTALQRGEDTARSAVNSEKTQRG